ncbi:hypothetical protein DENSPDRAFT_841477 [Dentipellis sp. KUC8613]|nr:hypothetical protein DENSPDRAFT_841477 [Dentipellis sp. KUC8613]
MLRTRTRARPLSSALLRPPRRRRIPARSYSQDSVTDVHPVDDAPPPPHTAEAWLFADSLFPIRLGIWDVRHYFGLFRQELVLDRLKQIVGQVHTHGFTPVSYEPYIKDGGVFIRFRYTGDASALQRIEADLKQHVESKGGIPSSTSFRRGGVWLVKGEPFREDMFRFSSRLLRVVYEGPDPREETVFHTFRPYGRIVNYSPATPVPNSPYRAAFLAFSDIRSAVIARNVVHGFTLQGDHVSGRSPTRLRIAFEPAVHAHAIRDWITNHPRIFLPVLVFLLGTLTYTIFDPIRTFMVKAKSLDWLDYREYRIYQWIRQNSLLRSSLSEPSESVINPESGNAWQQRRDAEEALRHYLTDTMTTAAFVHGPQGSGKTRMLNKILKDTDRPVVVVDMALLIEAPSDAQLVASLARQTGYWPVFTILNSMNNLIDLASVGLTGQKAGLSSTLSDQLEQILTTVSTALRSAAETRAQHAKSVRMDEQHARERKAQEEQVRERMQSRTWWDVRMGTLAGSGIMSELALGEEPFSDVDNEPRTPGSADSEKGKESAKVPDTQVIDVLPIVVLKNFETGPGRDMKEEVVNVLAHWAATLIEGQIAHVVVVSNNRENSKRMAKALPSKPLNMIALYDADPTSALQVVKQRLQENDMKADFTPEQVKLVERLGGRASDLAILIHKMRNGQSVEDAVEDIIMSNVSELRKNAFADDAEEAKSLPWSREQVWAVLRLLAERGEVSYYDMLVDFPFKGDDLSLRNMEQAELITITTVNGRPSVIKPGKPVYKHVFERLVHDTAFKVTQDFAYNTKYIEANENIVKACENELALLKDINTGLDTRHWWKWLIGTRSATQLRAHYLLKKMRKAETLVEQLDKKNVELKAVLKQFN